MARRDDVTHRSADGSGPAERATRGGYTWQAVGENVAAGHGSPGAVVEGWLASPGHCRNVMSGEYTEMGAAHAVELASRSTIYWTQVFGRPGSAPAPAAAERGPRR